MSLTKLCGVAAALALIGQVAFADQVTVRSTDDSAVITGELVSFDDKSFVLKTPFGNVTVARADVLCEGDACPKAEVNTDLLITGSDTVGEDLMPLLIEAYAETIQAQVTERRDLGDDIVSLEVRDEQGFGDELFTIAVQAKGSSVGLNDLIESKNQVAMASRGARAAEIRAIRDQGRGNLLDLS